MLPSWIFVSIFLAYPGADRGLEAPPRVIAAPERRVVDYRAPAAPAPNWWVSQPGAGSGTPYRRGPLPVGTVPRGARTATARGDPTCLEPLPVELSPAAPGFDERRLPSAARVIPATGSPATVTPAYVPQAQLELTVLPRANIARGRPDVPLPVPAASVYLSPSGPATPRQSPVCAEPARAARPARPDRWWAGDTAIPPGGKRR